MPGRNNWIGRIGLAKLGQFGFRRSCRCVRKAGGLALVRARTSGQGLVLDWFLVGWRGSNGAVWSPIRSQISGAQEGVGLCAASVQGGSGKQTKKQLGSSRAIAKQLNADEIRNLWFRWRKRGEGEESRQASEGVRPIFHFPPRCWGCSFCLCDEKHHQGGAARVPRPTTARWIGLARSRLGRGTGTWPQPFLCSATTSLFWGKLP